MRIALLSALLFVGMHLYAQDTTIMSIGLIGTATPFGWDADTNMVQDSADPDLWHLRIDLVDGEAKFRANDMWDINWGSTDFPVGIGDPGGDNIPVFAGTYDITFNSATGAYDFMVESSIGIIGDATAKGWDEDTDMFEDSTGLFFITIDLGMGAVKFRANNNWDVNWGSSDFPEGVGVQEGDDIPIDQAGTYFVTFDSTSGAYAFTALIDIDTVALIGDATAGGWEEVTLLEKDAENADVWVGEVTLTDGGLQFSVNNGEFILGDTSWPSGVAFAGDEETPADTIQAMAGKYEVEINVQTGEYSFQEVRSFASVGIIGDATPGGWETDTDMERSVSDSSMWTLRVELLDGFAKFRANDNWDVNWGSGDFPMGIGTQDGADIPVTAGDYLISFNSITGAYNFEAIVEYDAVSLVGKSGPFGDWPLTTDDGDASNNLFMDKSADDPQVWSATGVTVTSYEGADDEGVKFRADTSWTVNWGAEDFPSGIGTQDGPNIQTVAGTYDITFNSATGAYAFLAEGTVSSDDYLDPSTIIAFPNPVKDILFIEVNGIQLNGTVDFDVFDIQGKALLHFEQAAATKTSLDVTSLHAGQYFLRVSDGENIIGKRFIVN